jgi:hypothetical protein
VTFSEDLSVFLADFGEDVTLNGSTVRGIFDDPRAVEPLGGGLVLGRATFRLPSASVPSSPVGKSLVRGSSTYTVRAALPDGTGMSLLELEV